MGWGSMAILDRVVKEGLPEEGASKQRPVELREQVMHTTRGHAFQAEGTATAKALRLDCAWRV